MQMIGKAVLVALLCQASLAAECQDEQCNDETSLIQKKQTVKRGSQNPMQCFADGVKNDPQLAAMIANSPRLQQIQQEMQVNPMAGYKYMNDPDVKPFMAAAYPKLMPLCMPQPGANQPGQQMQGMAFIQVGMEQEDNQEDNQDPMACFKQGVAADPELTGMINSSPKLQQIQQQMALNPMAGMAYMNDPEVKPFLAAAQAKLMPKCMPGAAGQAAPPGLAAAPAANAAPPAAQPPANLAQPAAQVPMQPPALLETGSSAESVAEAFLDRANEWEHRRKVTHAGLEATQTEVKTEAATRGVTRTVITAGDGKTFPKKGDQVTMHYTGTLKDGTKFDSSRDRGTPLTAPIGIGRLIKGWDEGVPQMSLNERARLEISPDFGYGANGSPPKIPPNADLVFDVELLKIN